MRLLGVGQFSWYKDERISGRWGAFHLHEPHAYRSEGDPAALNRRAFRALAGKRVRLVARPLDEPRDSSRHALQRFMLEARRLARSALVVDEVELGVGRLRLERMSDYLGEAGRDVIVLQTGTRKEFWMAPRTFFRLSGRHVVVCAEPTNAPLAPTFEEAYGHW